MEFNISFKLDDENPNQVEIIASLKGDIAALTTVAQGINEGISAQLEKMIQSAAEAAE